MHFTSATFTSALLLCAVLGATASPMPAPAPAPEPVPEPAPAPIPPQLQPIIAAKYNLGGSAYAYDDPRFNMTHSRKAANAAAAASTVPLAFISVASITAGTLLAALV